MAVARRWDRCNALRRVAYRRAFHTPGWGAGAVADARPHDGPMLGIGGVQRRLAKMMLPSSLRPVVTPRAASARRRQSAVRTSVVAFPGCAAKGGGVPDAERPTPRPTRRRRARFSSPTLPARNPRGPGRAPAAPPTPGHSSLSFGTLRTAVSLGGTRPRSRSLRPLSALSPLAPLVPCAPGARRRGRTASSTCRRRPWPRPPSPRGGPRRSPPSRSASCPCAPRGASRRR